MKIIISNEEISVDVGSILGTEDDMPIINTVARLDDSVHELVKTCIDGFIKIKKTEDVRVNPFIAQLDTTELRPMKQEPPNYEIIRERLPNDLEPLNNNETDLSKVDTKQLPIRQYKNFICPNCGQGSVIKTLGELQSYCFREVNNEKTILISLNKEHVETLKDKYIEEKIEMPFSKYLIKSTMEGDENYSENIIEELDLAITTDGNLKCSCPSCNYEENFDKWYDAYKNVNRYFEYEPCIICGSETIPVIQKDKNLIQCENENCKHTVVQEKENLND